MVFNGALCESNGFCVHAVIEQDLVEEFLNHDLLNSKAHIYLERETVSEHNG